MGGFGGSRVSAQPVRAGGRFVRWAGHGRPRKFVLQAHSGLLGIAGALAAPAILAATSESVGARMSPWLVPGLLSRAGAPQAAMPATPDLQATLPTNMAEIARARVPGAVDRYLDRSSGVLRTGHGHSLVSII